MHQAVSEMTDVVLIEDSERPNYGGSQNKNGKFVMPHFEGVNQVFDEV